MGAGAADAPDSLLAPGLGAEQHAQMPLLASLAAMQSLKRAQKKITQKVATMSKEQQKKTRLIYPQDHFPAFCFFRKSPNPPVALGGVAETLSAPLPKMTPNSRNSCIVLSII